jgi:hypothetical protein
MKTSGKIQSLLHRYPHIPFSNNLVLKDEEDLQDKEAKQFLSHCTQSTATLSSPKTYIRARVHFAEGTSNLSLSLSLSVCAREPSHTHRAG